MIKLFPKSMTLGIYKAIYSFAKRKSFGDTLGATFLQDHLLNHLIQIQWRRGLLMIKLFPMNMTLGIYKSNIFPTDMDSKKFELPSDINTVQADPQIPEFTAPFILDDRYKIKYKNKTKINKPKRVVEDPFEPNEKEENTWLSFFPTQPDSIRKK